MCIYSGRSCCGGGIVLASMMEKFLDMNSI